ncbi:MAG: response regulator [Lachnospiraceae bacterium]|nr:response regulator [Lachnospiraceae bacterium]
MNTNSKTEKFIILLVSLACMGLTVESLMLNWEFWVPPIIVVGAISLWGMNLLEKPDYEIRKGLYLLYAMFAIFFHGVHSTSFFDVALIVSLVIIVFSLFDSPYMMNIVFIEYIIVMAIQFNLMHKETGAYLNALDTSRVILHITIVIFMYFVAMKSISDRLSNAEEIENKDECIENYEADMEDFLSNISHELRTPVNVVNGMSDMLIKKNAGDEAFSIKNAGIRLAYQIEDIQDYTECKRKKAILENDDYMSTSLINDVVSSFRLLENERNLELIVDLDPGTPTMMNGDYKKIHKIFRHLLENAVKFTKRGGIYVKLFSEPADYGINLCIEMTDTGIGMDRKSISMISQGLYQANKKRNRSSGGIGLGLFIVYGFAHRMGGFVKIESEKGGGTTVRVTLPQKVSNATPCLALSESFTGNILFHVRSDKYKVPRIRDFYRVMAANLAVGIKAPLYSAESVKEIENYRNKMDVSVIFMGEEEYEANSEYFDELSKGDIVVAVSAKSGFVPNPGSKVMVMPKPLYAYPVIKVLNEGRAAKNLDSPDYIEKPDFTGVKALIVDDELMNLVVASGLFREYGMIVDTAESGKESIKKFRAGNYDVIFMDHMMPEMDGVEAMKQIRKSGSDLAKPSRVIALTANAVSGAREMFMREGFDGFIAKPINIADFERVMIKVLPQKAYEKGGDRS